MTKIYPNSIDASFMTLRRLKNGTIYKTGDKYIESKEERLLKWELKKIGLPQYSETKFYDVFKMSWWDTLEMIKVNSEQETYIENLLKDSKVVGRKV